MTYKSPVLGVNWAFASLHVNLQPSWRKCVSSTHSFPHRCTRSGRRGCRGMYRISLFEKMYFTTYGGAFRGGGSTSIPPSCACVAFHHYSTPFLSYAIEEGEGEDQKARNKQTRRILRRALSCLASVTLWLACSVKYQDSKSRILTGS